MPVTLYSNHLQHIMNYTERQLQLNTLFQMGIDFHIEESNIDIRFLSFNSELQNSDNCKSMISLIDNSILENQSFLYPVFLPVGKPKSDKAILLLHGLNERNWNKYLTWAEYLCKKTGKPVILFPIAFHVNRSPQSWINPREVSNTLNLRRQRNGDDRLLSFANVAFSERISENPFRFYNSGRQSLCDLTQLFQKIKSGLHPLFVENTQIDIFAYSIGAFLAEITMMTNPLNLFSESKLFLFCGGGIFSAMFGQSRCIMDKMAYESLYNYYLNDFATDKNNNIRDKAFESFNSMISIERNKAEREMFFNQLGQKVKGISLSNDKVMPFYGVAEALGNDFAKSHIDVLDFSFDYSHENPFPVGKLFDCNEVDAAFNHVFKEAIDFLS